MIYRDQRRRIYAFIDESGKPEQLKKGPFVLAAVTVFEEDINISKEITRKFLNHWKILLQEATQMSVDFKEIHTREIVQGENGWRKVDPRLRNMFILSAASMLSQLPLYLNIVVTRLEDLNIEIRNPRGVRKHAFKLLLERVLYTTPDNIDELLIAYDSQSIGEDKKIEIDLLDGLRESYADFDGDVYMRFPHSEEEELIQWADFAAYTIRNIKMERYQVRGIELFRAFKVIEDKIRRCPSGYTYDGCGLKEWVIE